MELLRDISKELAESTVALPEGDLKDVIRGNIYLGYAGAPGKQSEHKTSI